MARRTDPTVKTVRFVLNGKAVSAEVPADRSLLRMLREDFDIISPKNGCAPQAQCGCCTVWVDGKPRLSCTLKAHKVDGREVQTLEGLAPELRRQIAAAFVQSGGLQCGYCTPGIAVRSVDLVARNPHPTRREIAHALRPHLCRCTGYAKIIDAIQTFAQLRGGAASPRLEESGKVGSSLPRYKGHDAVLGEKPFINDLKIPGMLRAVCRFTDHPRALVKALNTTRAEAVDGVKRVITAADVPGDRYVGLIEQDWPILVAVGEETRCVGDILAVVVADTEETARLAAELIKIDYEVRRPVTTPHEALQPDAPQIHPRGNLLETAVIKRGDAVAALAGSAHTVKQRFTVQRVEHLFLEPEACLARPTDNGVYVWSPGQGVFDDRRQIASVLGWGIPRVEVELVSGGGAFGGKEDLSVQAQTALAAHLTGAPVKLVLSRPESFRLHPKRHPMELDFRVDMVLLVGRSYGGIAWAL